MKIRTILSLLIVLCFSTSPCFGDAYEALIAKGDASIEKRELDNAISDFSRYIQINPAHATQAAPYLHRGRAYAQKGETEKAMSDLKKALELSPKAAEKKVRFFEREVALAMMG